MPISTSFSYKFKKERIRSLSESSIRHIYLKKKSTEAESGFILSCHYEKELSYVRQELTERTEEAEEIAHELIRIKNEEKQFTEQLQELTRDGSAKADTIAKLKEKVSELYVEVESLRCSHLQAISHQKDLQKEIDSLKCSRDWYADQLRLAQCVRDRIQNEPGRINNLLRDSSEINHRLAHENACLQAQLACSRAALADAKRNLSRQLESIRVDMIEREAVFKRITAERALFEITSRQRADEIRELKTQVSHFKMELKSTEEHLSLQKNKLLDAERALEVAESRRSELQNQLDAFEREHFTKESYLDDQIARYGIVLESLKDYENGHKSKAILIDEILEEKASLTAALSASKHEKEMLNNYLINLKDNLIRVEESFSILRCEIESKSAQIVELTSQRDNMADKIKSLYNQLSDYYKVIENLQKEKEELNSSLKVLRMEIEDSHNNLNKLDLSLQKTDVAVETVATLQPIELNSVLPSHMIDKVPTLESQTIYYPPGEMETSESQSIAVSLPNNLSTPDANCHSTLDILVDEASCWQSMDLNENLYRNALHNVAPASQNANHVTESDHDTQNNRLNSQENHPTTPLSTNKNTFLSRDRSSLVSVHVSFTSCEQNQMESSQAISSSTSQCYLGNWPYIQQLSDSQNGANVNPGFHISEAHIKTNQIYFYPSSHDNLSYTHEYKSNAYQDNLYACSSKGKRSSDLSWDIAISTNNFLAPSVGSPLDHISNNTNCDEIYTDPLVTLEQEVDENSNHLTQQNTCLSSLSNTVMAVSTEQDVSYSFTVTEAQNFLTNDCSGYFQEKINESETSVLLAKYFSCDQTNQANEVFHLENVTDSLLPVNETPISILCSFSPHETCNLIDTGSDKPEISELHPNERLNQSTIDSNRNGGDNCQYIFNSEPQNGDSLSTLDELNRVKNERNNLSEHILALQKDLAEAVVNLTTYRKEAEVQALNVEHEKVAHQQTLKAHQLTISELDNAKAELVKMQKLVSELRQEVVSSKEEVELLRVREDENRSLYETEINSMKSELHPNEGLNQSTIDSNRNGDDNCQYIFNSEPQNGDSLSTLDELNRVKNERNNLSEHILALQKDLAEAVVNLTTYRKEAEVQALNVEHEKVAHQQTLEAHQLTISELDNAKAELVKMQKLVSELRQEVVSSKEEVELLRVREDENRSLYETEINSMKSIVKITTDHLSTLAESLYSALDEKAILQAKLDRLEHGIHGQLQKFRLFTRLELHGESKVVNQCSLGSLAALGIHVENMVDGNPEMTFHRKSPRKFTPSFECLRTEITELENDLLSRSMLVSDLTQNK
ncbi:unnamed protein product [Schistosoma turkestanicum]|nr:unnamed protein product [Schistosoma turkestanicum]